MKWKTGQGHIKATEDEVTNREREIQCQDCGMKGFKSQKAKIIITFIHSTKNSSTSLSKGKIIIYL